MPELPPGDTMTPDDVTAVLVTRGDQELAIQQIIASLIFDNVVVWNNAAPRVPDLGAYGRYMLCRQGVTTPWVWLQDDDCVVSGAVQQAMLDEMGCDGTPWLSNMNPWHNAGMPLLALPGWGALAHTASVVAADSRWRDQQPDDWASDDYRRVGCDIVIPVLLPNRMIDFGHENLSFAWDQGRTHLQPGYGAKKSRYYQQAAEIRGRLHYEGVAV